MMQTFAFQELIPIFGHFQNVRKITLKKRVCTVIGSMWTEFTLSIADTVSTQDLP